MMCMLCTLWSVQDAYERLDSREQRTRQQEQELADARQAAQVRCLPPPLLPLIMFLCLLLADKSLKPCLCPCPAAERPAGSRARQARPGG
jgi:hypothetical protein